MTVTVYWRNPALRIPLISLQEYAVLNFFMIPKAFSVPIYRETNRGITPRIFIRSLPASAGASESACDISLKLKAGETSFCYNLWSVNDAYFSVPAILTSASIYLWVRLCAHFNISFPAVFCLLLQCRLLVYFLCRLHTLQFSIVGAAACLELRRLWFFPLLLIFTSKDFPPLKTVPPYTRLPGSLNTPQFWSITEPSLTSHWKAAGKAERLFKI